MAIDAGIDQPVGGLRRQQHVIDADAVILGPGAGLVVPEGVEVGGIAAGADRVGEAEIEQRAEFLPGLRQEQRVLGPGGRIAGDGRGRDDVVVACQKHRLFQLQPFK